MANNPHDERPIVIIEDENRTPPTTQARGVLYTLIARFRQDAAEAEDKRTRSIFEFAAEVISGLARAFKSYEEETQNQNDGDGDGNGNGHNPRDK